MKKRNILLLLTSMVACTLSGCDGGKYDKYIKLAPNIYEVTVKDYDYDYFLLDGIGNNPFPAACSAIREGNYLGRNFDFIAGDASEIVVKTKATKDHHASVGVVAGLSWLTTSFMDNGLDEDAKKLIPLMLLDGINDQGVAIEINCVNAVDVGGKVEHTNPGKKQVAQLAVVRYLLDHASSADNAIEIMKDIDICLGRDAMGLQLVNFEVHFLIADKDKTYIVEFDNTLQNGEKMVILEDECIQTNFYLHKADVKNEIYPDNAMGVERYRKLRDNKKNVISLDSMKELMKSIRYTNSYRLDGEYAPGDSYDNPYTCFSDHPVFGENPINYANQKDNISQIVEMMEDEGEKIKTIMADPNLVNPKNIWFTCHSNVYDIVNKTMTISIFERFNTYYNFSL